MRTRARSKKGTAGIIATVIMFAILFTVGGSYFLFVSSSNQSYVKSYVNRANAADALASEGLTVTSLLVGSDIGFYFNNTGGVNLNVTAVLVFDSSGNLLKCDGVGVPAGTCSNSTPALPVMVNTGRGSPKIDTGYAYVSGTDTIEILTARGGVFTTTYPPNLPNYAMQAESSGALTIDLSTFKWMTPTGNIQSGQNVGGYPATAVPSQTDIVFRISFTNRDATGRSVTLWPGSSITVNTIQPGGGNNAKMTSFFIIDGTNTPFTSINPYNSTQDYITIAAGANATLYFGSQTPLSNSFQHVGDVNEAPFTAFFTLSGQYSDNTLYAQTIPFPAGVVTGSTVRLSSTSGGSGATVTVSCGGGCQFLNSRIGFVGWIGSTGAVTTLTTFTTMSNGDLPSSLTFTVPTAAAGYYTVVVSDYFNTVYVTFHHT